MNSSRTSAGIALRGNTRLVLALVPSSKEISSRASTEPSGFHVYSILFAALVIYIALKLLRRRAKPKAVRPERRARVEPIVIRPARRALRERPPAEPGTRGTLLVGPHGVETTTVQAGSGLGAAAVPLIELGAVAREARPARWIDAWIEGQIAAEVRRHNARPRGRGITAESGVTEQVHARAIIRRACLKAALAGGATGALSTGASVATAETQGLAGVLALPAAALSVAAEAVLRLRLHVRMTCEIVGLFGLRFEPEAPADLWALLALTFGAGAGGGAGGSPGTRLLGVARLQGASLSKRLGARLASESLARNLVPFVDVASSSIANWVLTRRLGDTVRRYARYRRAFDEALASDEGLLRHRDLLVAGVWFLFTADGPPTPEETALLASLLRPCEPALQARLDDLLADDIAWVARLPGIPGPSRASFLHALEVAAAVDKRASLRERKLIAHAARALGLERDEARVDRMIREFEEVGVLCLERPPAPG